MVASNAERRWAFAFRGRRRRAMSIVAMSDTVGSLGDEVGRAVARALGYEFADREIIKTAAARFGESVLDLQHAAEEKPKLWERFRSTTESLRAMQVQSLLAQARAALLAHATTRPRRFGLACADGVITLEGGVDAAQVRQAAEDVVARIPGVTRVQNEIVVAFEPIVNEAEELSHHQFRHGEERSWGGYGGGWYDREWEARRRLGQDSDRVA